jgi:hypothetical protein
MQSSMTIVLLTVIVILLGVQAVTIDVCITTSVKVSAIHNLSECLAFTGNQLNTDISDSSGTASSLLRAVTFTMSSVNVSVVYSLDLWAQTVLLAFVRSKLTRQRQYVRLTAATVSGSLIKLPNTTSSTWWVQDLGACTNMSGFTTPTSEPIIIDGYMASVSDAMAMVYSGQSLIAKPQYYDMTGVVRAFNAQAPLAFLTFPPSTQNFGFYGAVYTFEAGIEATSMLVLWASSSLNGRKNNLKFRLNCTVAPNGTVMSLASDPIDLASTDTPVPSLLPNGVTSAPITQSVMAWYIYLIIGLGVLGGIVFFVFLAKKARLRKEDKKKTAKRRKKDQDRFDKIASELRHGIDVDDDAPADEG